MPSALGGTNDQENLFVACCSCNRARGKKDPTESRVWVRRSVHFRQSPTERFEDAFDQMRAAMGELRATGAAV